MFQAEMTFAIRYAQVQAALSSRLNYQASQFLLELQRLHSLQLFKQMALISSFLAELPLQMEHAIINLRIGISLNFQVRCRVFSWSTELLLGGKFWNCRPTHPSFGQFGSHKWSDTSGTNASRRFIRTV